MLMLFAIFSENHSSMNVVKNLCISSFASCITAGLSYTEHGQERGLPKHVGAVKGSDLFFILSHIAVSFGMEPDVHSDAYTVSPRAMD